MDNTFAEGGAESNARQAIINSGIADRVLAQVGRYEYSSLQTGESKQGWEKGFPLQLDNSLDFWVQEITDPRTKKKSLQVVVEHPDPKNPSRRVQWAVGADDKKFGMDDPLNEAQMQTVRQLLEAQKPQGQA